MPSGGLAGKVSWPSVVSRIKAKVGCNADNKVTPMTNIGKQPHFMAKPDDPSGLNSLQVLITLLLSPSLIQSLWQVGWQPGLTIFGASLHCNHRYACCGFSI